MSCEPRRRSCRGLLVVVALVLAAAACGTDPVTQIVVVIDTDVRVPSELDTVFIRVEGPSTERTEQTVTLDGVMTAIPLTFGMVPASSSLGPVIVTVTGRLGALDLMTRVVRTRFVSGSSRLLRVRLLRSCIDVFCGTGQTCDETGCRDEVVEAAELPDFDGTIRIDEVCNGSDDDRDGMVDEDFDLQTDARNCGACGRACDGGQPCRAGLCIDSPIVAIAAGLSHTCALREAGGIACWGSNTYGELGDGTTVPSVAPVTVTGVEDARDVSAGGGYTCAVRGSGASACWGSGGGGELGSGMFVDQILPTPTMGITDAVQVTTGWYHGCVVRSGGGVRCWGHDTFGELGNGTMAAMVAGPVDVLDLTDALEVRVGFEHTCARRRSGALSCWGNGGRGQLGTGMTVAQARPTAVSGITDAAEVETGDTFSCARRSTGAVLCWGSNDDGEIGADPTTTMQSAMPLAVSGLTDTPRQLSAACPTDTSGGSSGQGGYTCALGTSGVVYCWGRNDLGQLGDGTTTSRHTPARVSTIAGVRQVSAGAGHACALLETPREVWCWGDNTSGQLGDGTTTQSLVPVHVMGL